MTLDDTKRAIVSAPCGLIRGVEDGVASGVDTYLGIPYAQAPVGELRWRPPQPLADRSELLVADRFGPDAVQEPNPHLRGAGMSEDCLYLNVWAPKAAAGEKRPVMVWIHGDGYTRGSGSNAIYDGCEFARRGVVLVTVNYRLGLAGFMAHRQLTAESPMQSSGNYGLLDQIEALKWVRRNVSAFGGDAERITVFGQSAGASCLHLLMASELAAGLFQQAILQSPGTMRPLATREEAEAAGEKIGSDIDELRKLPIESLLGMAGRLVPPIRRLASPRGLGPIIDDWAVRGNDAQNYAAGRIRPIPLIVGATANEGRKLATRFPFKTLTPYRTYLSESFASMAELPRSYLAESDAEVADALERVVGDTQFTFGTWSVAESMRLAGGKPFVYIFAQPLEGSDLAPTHDDELPYVFGSLVLGGLKSYREQGKPVAAESRRLSESLMSYWVNFATSGTPNDDRSTAWPVFDAAGSALIFADPIRAGSVPRVNDLKRLGEILSLGGSQMGP